MLKTKLSKPFNSRAPKIDFRLQGRGNWKRLEAGEREKEGKIKQSTTTLGKKGAQRLPKIFEVHFLQELETRRVSLLQFGLSRELCKRLFRLTPNTAIHYPLLHPSKQEALPEH